MTDHPDEATVLTRDLSSGKIHRRVRIGNGLASLEGDNLDDAGDFEVITSVELANAEGDQLCLRCFPDIGDAGDAA